MVSIQRSSSWLAGLVFGLMTLLLVGSAAAQTTYPVKPIRWVIPVAPGGGAEIVGTTVAKKLTAAFKQPVVVEFRPGGTGAVGSELIAKAPPDGYSLLQGQLAWISIYPALHAKPAYDPLHDFAPISRLVFVTQVLLVHPSLPAKSLKDLVALAKLKPGDILYGAASYGSGAHLAMEWIKAARASTSCTHRPQAQSRPLRLLSPGIPRSISLPPPAHCRV